MALPKPRHTISYNLNEYEKYHYYYLTYGLGKDRAAFGPYSNLTAKHASTQGSRHSSASEKDKQIAPVTSTVDPTTAGTRYTTRGRVKPVTDPSAPSSSSGAGHQVAPVVPPKPKGGKGKGKDVGNDKSVTHSDKKGSSMPPPPVPVQRPNTRKRVRVQIPDADADYSEESPAVTPTSTSFNENSTAVSESLPLRSSKRRKVAGGTSNSDTTVPGAPAASSILSQEMPPPPTVPVRRSSTDSHSKGAGALPTTVPAKSLDDTSMDVDTTPLTGKRATRRSRGSPANVQENTNTKGQAVEGMCLCIPFCLSFNLTCVSRLGNSNSRTTRSHGKGSNNVAASVSPSASTSKLSNHADEPAKTPEAVKPTEEREKEPAPVQHSYSTRRSTAAAKGSAPLSRSTSFNKTTSQPISRNTSSNSARGPPSPSQRSFVSMSDETLLDSSDSKMVLQDLVAV